MQSSEDGNKIARRFRDAIQSLLEVSILRDALPVVTTTWALSQLPLESHLRFLHRLDEAATGRVQPCSPP